ncbi:hypothetical protein [Massilia sp. Leaf139]|uniref:hypothetical protein n=1 Tax=Massilia sp. Leaf139 TaxID=1736272 RepID=UPI0007141062|nr:hypothetical protein [Massilia sp. Leaf139]KQQ94977.1 hypothetical protein ASF77_22270 [Massilia sp. Leaf139]
MRSNPHNPTKTRIAMYRECVEEWRKREGWSRETVCQMIVEAHESIGGPATTDIRFEPPTTDAYERQKVNAERIFRWLDDVSKDRNLLPANFEASIEAAFPIDIYLKFENMRLARRGVELRLVEAEPRPALDVTPHVRSMVKEDAEAISSLLSLGPDSTVEQLKAACRELQDAEDSAAGAKRDIQCEIARRSAEPKAVV